jgi:cytochrome c-type biogenesis protein CcsB
VNILKRINGPVRSLARAVAMAAGLTAAWPATATAASDLDFTALKYIAVQKDGRKKPLDTVATETVQKLTGKSSWTDPETGRRLEPMDVALSMWMETREWETTPVILVNYRPLKDRLGLDPERRLFSFAELMTPAFQEFRAGIAAKDRANEDLTREEREAKVVWQRLATLREQVGPGSLAIVPHPHDPKGDWEAVTAAARHHGADAETQMHQIYQRLAAGYLAREPSVFNAAAHELSLFLRGLSPSVYPGVAELRREVHYNSFHPFRKALYFYLASFLVLVATWRSRQPACYWMGVAMFLAAVAVHAYAFYLRIMISGRPPVTNMYESVVWVSFGAALFALVFELIWRQRYFLAATAPVSMVMLVLADQLPAVLDPSIGPLTPVLRDNFWLSVHVPTITLGYAAFAVALGLGHLALGLYIFAPAERGLIARLEYFIYRSMQVGVLLLAAGTILGGIWAHYAWGRFWGWDPKETWALIALLAYLVPLHGRLAGWMSNFALCVASVLSFLAILMAWYGVNFVLGKGLHSYGFGVGGYGYVMGFVLFELAYVGLAAWRRSVGHAPAPQQPLESLPSPARIERQTQLP